MCPEQAAKCSDSLKTQELSLIWVCLLNQCCKIGWHFVNLSYTLHSFYENGLVCSIVFRLCKSGSSQVVRKKPPHNMHFICGFNYLQCVLFYWGCSLVLVGCVVWKFLGGSPTVISPAGRKLLWCLGWGSEQGTLWQWALQGLKYHPIPQCLDPPVTADSWTQGFQTVLLQVLHSTEVAFTYLSQVKQMPKIVPSKKSGNECTSMSFTFLNCQKVIITDIEKLLWFCYRYLLVFSRLLNTRATPVCSFHTLPSVVTGCLCHHCAVLCCSGFCSSSKHPSFNSVNLEELL